MEGNIQRANAYLEHFFPVLSTLEPARNAAGSNGFSQFMLRVDDPDKLLPPEGAYAVSLQQGSRQIKGAVLIHKENVFLPLEPDFQPNEEQVRIQFHKRIQSRTLSPMDHLLEKVRELIY